MLEKVAKITGILASVAAVMAVILFALSKMDLSFIFGPKTYEAEYVPGVYTTDGYVSTFLGYKFTVPEKYELSDVEERAMLSGGAYRGLSVTDMEAGLKEQKEIMDMWAKYTAATNDYTYANTMVSVQMNEEISKKDLKKVAEEVLDDYTRMGITLSEDYEITEYLGRKCATYLGSVTVAGIKVNQRGYIFAENGYTWILMISYLDGMEEDEELLKNAYEIYE